MANIIVEEEKVLEAKKSDQKKGWWCKKYVGKMAISLIVSVFIASFIEMCVFCVKLTSVAKGMKQQIIELQQEMIEKGCGENIKDEVVNSKNQILLGIANMQDDIRLLRGVKVNKDVKEQKDKKEVKKTNNNKVNKKKK